MLIDFPTYVNIRCEKYKITTLHRTVSGYIDIPNRPNDDLGICISCDNILILDEWYREYIEKNGFIIRT